MNSTPAILIVDYNARNVDLLRSFLDDAGYRAFGVSTLEALDEILDGGSGGDEIALALVDLTGFPAGIWERCRRIHEAEITFIVIARGNSNEAERDLRAQSRRAGARHALTKPLRKEQLLTLVRILTGSD